jgi:MFS family permease
VWLEALGYSATTIGAILTAGAVAAVVIRPFMPVVSRACGGTARTLVVAMALVSVAVGVLGAVNSVAAFMALGVIGGAGTGFGLPLTIVAVARNVVGRHRGAALGLRLSFNRAANLVAPVAVGAILDATGFGVGFAVAGAILAGLTVLAAAWVPRYERTESEAMARAADRATDGATDGASVPPAA